MSRTQPKIYFIANGNRISFAAWLNEQKEASNLSWRRFSEEIGIKRVHAYSLNTFQGKPNCPPTEKFQKIINTLGYSEEDFEIIGEGLINKQSPPEAEKLKEKAEEAIKRGFEIVRSPIVRIVAGESFYRRYGYGEENTSRCDNSCRGKQQPRRMRKASSGIACY